MGNKGNSLAARLKAVDKLENIGKLILSNTTTLRAIAESDTTHDGAYGEELKRIMDAFLASLIEDLSFLLDETWEISKGGQHE